MKPHIIYEDKQATIDTAHKEKLYGKVMRQILHNPIFSELESLWLSIEFLISTINMCEEDYNLYIIDVAKSALDEDLSSIKSLSDSAVFKVLSDNISSLSGESWDLLIGDYSFGINKPDINLLKKITQLASHLNVPFIAAGKTSAPLSFHEELNLNELLELPTELLSEWNNLRNVPESKNVGLAFPRFLLRYPYGEKYNPIECFNFEEIAPSLQHNNFLWGNSAFLCAAILISEEVRCNWNTILHTMVKINDLPTFTVQTSDGNNQIVPTVESWVTDRHVNEILSIGMLPIIPIRNATSAYIHFSPLQKSQSSS